DRKSTRLNSSHVKISYAVFCLKKKNDEELRSAQVVLHLDAARWQQTFAEAVTRLRLDQLHRRCIAGLDPRVLEHALDRCRQPFRRDLRIEQGADAGEDQPGNVGVGDLKLLL